MKKNKAGYSIVFEDDSVLAVYKMQNVLSVATNDKKTFHHNLQYSVSSYLKAKGEACHLIHRLDFETSGIVVFAKNLAVKKQFQTAFKENQIERDYEAVVKEDVSGRFDVTQYLKEIGSKVIVADKEEGKIAVTHIQSANRIQIGTVLKIRIDNGRHNQIRLALKELGLTLIGDARFAKDSAKRMYLNAYHLHPTLKELETYDFQVKPLWLIEDKASQS